MTDLSAPPVVGTPTDTLEVLDEPRRHVTVTRRDRIDIAVSWACGAVAALTAAVIFDWRNPASTVVWAVLIASAVSYVLHRERLGRVAAVDRLMTTLVWGSGAIAVGVLVWMVGFLTLRGIGSFDVSFFTEDMSKAGPLDANGGAFHAIVGTVQQTGLATIVAVPLGILTAIYLHEITGRLAPLVRFVVDAMSGLPSIVAGLLVYAVWSSRVGYSGASGSAALIVIMLPIITRTAEEMLRTVDNGLRESALALGAQRWSVVLRVVVPTARTGLITASILGVARVAGETAPVLLTSFGSSSTNWNPFSGQQASLPLFVWQLIRVPNTAQNNRAFSAALLLMALVLVLFVLTRVIASRGSARRGAKR